VNGLSVTPLGLNEPLPLNTKLRNKQRRNMPLLLAGLFVLFYNLSCLHGVVVDLE
jgi:hypothetical protein